MDWKKEIKIPRPSLSGLREAPSRIRDLLSRGPEVPTPSFSSPSLKRPKALRRGPQIQMPRVVSDLYADLRDRHLLPLVAVLIAAIIAAPILLNKSSEKKSPTATANAVAASGEGESSDSSFTVVPAGRSLRSPSKRLGHRKALNPFRVAKEAGETETAEASGSGGSGEGSGGESGGSSGSGGGSEVVIESTSEVTSTGSTGTEGSSGGESGGSSSGSNVTVEVGVVRYVAHINAGLVSGELTEREISPMTKLPSAKDPVVLFTGFSADDKRALFLMTSKVTGYYGDVHCAVDKSACQMVELAPGHTATFTYGSGANEETYKIELKKIEEIVIKGEDASAESVEKTSHERPAERDSAVANARSFSK